MNAHIYARWSSLDQGKGSTLVRQTEKCADFIQQRGWKFAGPPILDKGKSAYTGDNIRTGSLSVFAKRFDAGAFPRDTVLVVEELDRLSRQPADVMLSWLSPLIREGLTIAVTNTGQIINSAFLDHDIGSLMSLFIGAFGSNTESRKKSERVAAAWDVKRRNAREGKSVTRNHRHPLWIDVDGDSFKLMEDRAAIVRLIFQMRIEGKGKGAIAKHLNESRVETWAIAGSAGNLVAKLWQPTYVSRVIRNRAVVGEWQPFSSARRDTKRSPIGEPIANYYPAVVSEETFMRANDLRIAATLKTQGRGRSLSNLIGPVARCAKCGFPMVALGSSRYRTWKDGTVTRHYFLYCQGAKIAKKCDNQRGWPYDRVERPLLDSILALAMDDQHFASDDDETAILEAAALKARAEVERIRVRKARVFAMAEEGDDDAIARNAELRAELRAAQERQKSAEETLAAALGQVPVNEHIRRVAEVRALMMSDDQEERFQARSKVKVAVAGLIESMLFDPVTGNVAVAVKGGLRRIVIRQDGTISDFDFHKAGTPIMTANPAIEAYARRIGAIVELPSVEIPAFDIHAKLEQIAEGRETLRQINRDRDRADAEE